MLKYIDVDSASGSVQKHTVMLLHAFPLSAAMWQSQIEPLAQAGLRVIAPHAYGVEGSAEKENWTFTEYAHELAELLESHGVNKATIVGLSMGGYQAFEFYRLYPDKTASLVLCDTRAEGDAPEARKNREEFIHAVETNGAEEAVKRMIPNYFTAATYTYKPELVAQAKDIIRKQSPKDITDAMRAIMQRNDSSSLLPNIHCPVLVLNGVDDKLTTPDTARSISSRIPGSQLQLLAEAGHISNMEQPEEFNRALLDHIEEVRLT